MKKKKHEGQIGLFEARPPPQKPMWMPASTSVPADKPQILRRSFALAIRAFAEEVRAATFRVMASGTRIGVGDFGIERRGGKLVGGAFVCPIGAYVVEHEKEVRNAGGLTLCASVASIAKITDGAVYSFMFGFDGRPGVCSIALARTLGEALRGELGSKVAVRA